ncbi:MAG: MOSC domain-containing protein [Candidatus Eremiobacteraeota bacterium]|nr:MOSC domain-containing protein [Candidatus Eremiobacteraeota bacterium]
MLQDPEEAARAAAERGVELELRSGERYFDAGCVSLVLDTWIADVERALGRPLDPLRWRPNLYVRAANGAPAESDLIGAVLAAGETLLRVLRPIQRCATPTYDQETGVSSPELSRYVAQERANVMGVYCDVARTGIVRTGDRLELS